MATKFINDDSQRNELVTVICEKLKELNQYLAASEIYLSGDRAQDAVESLIAANEWSKAKKVTYSVS